jgi:hypothetical protein
VIIGHLHAVAAFANREAYAVPPADADCDVAEVT